LAKPNNHTTNSLNLLAKINSYHHKLTVSRQKPTTTTTNPQNLLEKKPTATTTNQEIYRQKPTTTTINPQNIINRERERVRDSQKSKKNERETNKKRREFFLHKL
jgi:hypothetical protein